MIGQELPVTSLITGSCFQLIGQEESFVCLGGIYSDKHKCMIIHAVAYHKYRAGDFFRLESFHFDRRCMVTFMGMTNTALTKLHQIDSLCNVKTTDLPLTNKFEIGERLFN